MHYKYSSVQLDIIKRVHLFPKEFVHPIMKPELIKLFCQHETFRTSIICYR